MLNNAEAHGQIGFLKALYAIIRWSVIRHRYLLVVFTLIQMVFAVTIVYGMAFLIPALDGTASVYLASGAMSLGIIAVGCALAPQIISEAKINGVLTYQRTLPVPRSILLVSDMLIWCAASVPGIIMSGIAGSVRFHIGIEVSVMGICVLLAAQLVTICIGFAIAYCFPSNIVALVTQVIMLGGLLFSPITYPAERLPAWTMPLYNSLPFVRIAQAVRSYLFGFGSCSGSGFAVMLVWGAAAFILCLYSLSKRG